MPQQSGSRQQPSHRHEERRERALRLISDAAHDLVGPVNQVSSLVELFVRRYRSQLDDEAQVFLQHIASAGVRLTATAGGLGTYFSIVTREFSRTRVPARASLEAALMTLPQEIRAARAEIDVGELPAVDGDSGALTTLWRVLLDNSLKFRQEGQPPHIRITAERSTDVCRFSFVDDGIGVEPQYRDEVFLAFKKLNGHLYPGSGMGLTIARAITDALGGQICIEDTAGPGTTVVFELPAPT